jgi:hypothetical protein
MNGANSKRSVTVVVCEIPVSANVLRRKYKNYHAYGRYRDGWKRTLYGLITGSDRAWLMANAAIETKMKMEVSLRHQRLFDSDNATAALKPILDSLVSLKFLANDDTEHLDLHVSQEKVRDAVTSITISEAQP